MNDPPSELAMLLSAASSVAMLLSACPEPHRRRLWCPLNGRGCEAVAMPHSPDPSACPMATSAFTYASSLPLLLLPVRQRWSAFGLVVLGVLAVAANILVVYDMSRLGSFCTYCLLTAMASPLLLWCLWRLR